MLPLYFYHDLKWKWSGKKQLKDIIVVAGFEIYDAEITPHYIFTKPQDTTISQVEEATKFNSFMTIVQVSIYSLFGYWIKRKVYL